MIRGSVIAIGSELLEGSIQDTNSSSICSKLSSMGVKMESVVIVPDVSELIVEAFEKHIRDYDITLTTGGLGPTFDDITAECAALSVGVATEKNETAYAHLEKRLSKINVEIADGHIRQTYLPKGCELFPNDMGTAYGFGVSMDGKYIIAMPGVPHEMYMMFDKYVAPFVSDRFSLPKRYSKDLHFFGVSESYSDDVLKKLMMPNDVECIINSSKGEVIIRLRGYSDNVDIFAGKLVDYLRDYYVGDGTSTLRSQVTSLLRMKGLRVAFAESCTGGYIGQEITSVDGASEVFNGSSVVYSNDSKINVLNVDKGLIDKYGAVSCECAESMAVNVANLYNADIGLSVTGIAGPTGGSEDKPVGTVIFSIYYNGKTTTHRKQLAGDRNSIRARSANIALDLIRNLLTV